MRALSVVGVVLVGLASAFCGGSTDSEFDPPGGNDDGGASSSSGFAPCDGCAAGDSAPSGPVCGDKRITDKESCDDGNTANGDGCSATCTVETGYVCPNVGLKCEAAKCGDGVLAGSEECEFAPGTTVVGCDANCKITDGYDCDPALHTCAPVVCGDGKVQRGENCEDGNDLPFDGCYKCQKEPACTNGLCKGQCGDGQKFAGEACDDGNTRAGDGCSPTCTIETGFTCTDLATTPPASIALPVLLRDFIGVGNELAGATPHTDFNGLNGSGVLGIVEPTLTAGKPKLNCPGGDCTQNPGALYYGGAARPNISNAANFLQWFTTTANVNLPSAITIPLARQGLTSTYQWDSADTAVNGGKDYFDPVGLTGGWIAAGKEQSVCTPARNVSFTSETHFVFEYQGGERFDFAGDDDTWVFVNNKLALDLGGLHTPKTGNFVLDPTNGSATFSSDMPQAGSVALGLVKGNIYEVVMFQAERNQCGSNFKVTLRDFNKPKSACASTCGDGIVASDELCDDGKNDGSYGGCQPGCKARGAHCGDGKVDPQEQCDDGNTNDSDGCTTTCRPSSVN